MNKRLLLPIVLCMLLFATACQSYTTQQAKKVITLPSDESEPTITKYSTIEAERQAVLASELAKEQETQRLLEEKQKQEQRLLEEQQKQEQALQEEQQRASWQKARDEDKATIMALEAKLVVKESAIVELNAKLASSLQKISLAESEAGSTNQRLVLTLQELEDLKESYNALSYQAGELQGLLTEQQIIKADLQLQLALAEESSLAKEEALSSEHAIEVQALKATIQSLNEEASILKAQLGEKTSTLEEKLRLEGEREAEAKRIAEQKQREAEEQEAKIQQSAEEERLKQAALDEQYRQIPPLSSLTYPRTYTTGKPTTLFSDQDRLHVMLLVLDDIAWSDKTMAQEVKQSISDLSYPVIFLTGHMQNVIDVVRAMGEQAVLVEGGAIITTMPLINTASHGASVQFSEKKTLRLGLANLPEYEVLSAFAGGGDWQSVQKRNTSKRLDALKAIVGQGTITEPTIIGSSLFEPSHQDWNTFSPVTYRQIDYLWPLSSFLEDAQFYDVYRATHFSSATDAGNTFIKGELKERIDYLFSRKLLPLSSSMLTIGGESVADASGIQRYGLVASFLVP